jgi:hypothetical protein
MLSSKNLRTTRPSRKLDWKSVGPFPIVEVISSHAYRLQLPSSMAQVHPVFHPVLLRAVPKDPLPGQRAAEPPPVVVDAEQEYEVRQIVNSRVNKRNRTLEYLVQWTGYDQMDWEPACNVTNASELLREFHTKYPEKPTHETLQQSLQERTSHATRRRVQNTDNVTIREIGLSNAQIDSQIDAKTRRGSCLAGARPRGGVMSQSQACAMSQRHSNLCKQGLGIQNARQDAPVVHSVRLQATSCM